MVIARADYHLTLILFAGKCHDPPIVPHASHNGPSGQRTFPLGTQLTYSCGAGYNIDGFFRAMCVGEGRWVGPRMICSRTYVRGGALGRASHMFTYVC